MTSPNIVTLSFRWEGPAHIETEKHSKAINNIKLSFPESTCSASIKFPHPDPKHLFCCHKADGSKINTSLLRVPIERIRNLAINAEIVLDRVTDDDLEEQTIPLKRPHTPEIKNGQQYCLKIKSSISHGRDFNLQAILEQEQPEAIGLTSSKGSIERSTPTVASGPSKIAAAIPSSPTITAGECCSTKPLDEGKLTDEKFHAMTKVCLWISSLIFQFLSCGKIVDKDVIPHEKQKVGEAVIQVFLSLNEENRKKMVDCSKSLDRPKSMNMDGPLPKLFCELAGKQGIRFITETYFSSLLKTLEDERLKLEMTVLWSDLLMRTMNP